MTKDNFFKCNRYVIAGSSKAAPAIPSDVVYGGCDRNFCGRYNCSIIDYALPVLAGLLLALVLFPYGPGTTPDSISYLNYSFTSSATGNALFAPVFPAILALLPGDSLQKLSIVTYLNPIFLTVSLYLLIKMLREAQCSSYLALFVCTLPALWHTHRHCLSEPIFILFEIFLFRAIFALAAGTPAITRTTAISILLPLIRFAGLSFSLSAAIVSYAASRRIANLLLPLMAFLPFPIWAFFNGTVGTRVWSVHLPTPDSLLQIPISIAGTFVAGLANDSAIALGLCFLFLITAPLLWRSCGYRVKISALAIAINLLLIWTSKAFLDANIPFNIRIFAPLIVPFLIAMNDLTAIAPALVKKAFSLLLCLLAVSNIYSLSGELKSHYLNGHGYTSRIMRESALFSAVKRDFPNHTVISNFPDALTLYLPNRMISLTERYAGQTLIANKSYATSLEGQLEQVKKGNAILVYFRIFNWRRYLPQEAEITEILGSTPIYQDEIGAIYQAPLQH